MLFVLPVCVLCGDWLAGKLSDNQTTRMLIQGSLMICPVLCIASMPFILCRPVFEGLGAGRPVALLATLRYLVLTLPACYGGLTIAERLGHPPLYGLLAGLVFATTVVSGISQLLLHRALRTG